MAKQVTVLGLGNEILRGVRLDEAGEALVRGSEEAWPLVDEPADGEGELGADASAEAPTAEVVVEDRPLVRAFKAAAARFGTREFVLSVPLSRLLVKAVRLPAEARGDLAGAARLELDGISPFPDEALTPGAEVVAETDKEIVALVAALPSAASEEISEALAAAKVHVTRTDATALGWLRGLWPQICQTPGLARRLVLLDLDGGWDLVLLDGDAPTYLRGIGPVGSADELVREIMLSLLQSGGDAADEVVVCTQAELDGELAGKLAQFGAVRTVSVEDDFAGVEGAARRSAEEATLDVTPEAWREARAESRFRRSMCVWLGVTLGAWLLLMGVLFGYDIVYGFCTSHQKSLQADKAHRAALKNVTAMKDRVTLIERYADHEHGALAVLKVVSDNLPVVEDMTFRQFQYRRGESVRVNGTAGQREDIRAFTENLEAAAFEDSEEALFQKVQQSGGESQTKKGIRFAIECFFQAEEEETPQKGRGK